jgi:hypothetical protein
MRSLSAISRRLPDCIRPTGCVPNVCYHLASPRKRTVSEPPKAAVSTSLAPETDLVLAKARKALGPLSGFLNADS